jgi:hypothetical protein
MTATRYAHAYARGRVRSGPPGLIVGVVVVCSLSLTHTGTQAINMMVMQQKTIAEKLAEAGTRPLMGTVRDQQ